MKNWARQLCDEMEIEKNPYFQSMRDGSFDREDFLRTQSQFFFAVEYFNRPMAALAARIPTNLQRVEVLRNAWEEHGEGNLRESHRQTFITLLSRLGVDVQSLDRAALWPEVDQFNASLGGVCLLESYRVGASMLGIIEYMFAEISGWVARFIVDSGWLESGDLVHYHLHQALDVRHSQDFFDIVAADRETHREEIQRGLRLGASAFDSLYRGLYRARGRR